MNHKTIALIGLMSLLDMLSFAQSPEASLKPIATPSPQAASLMKFVETPVSYFNGLPDISIPLHEINENGIKVPITLSYHASGLRVTEEASWVGLGWSLEAGGAITHVPRGLDDDYHCNTRHMLGEVYPNNVGKTYIEHESNRNLVGCSYYNENGVSTDFTDEFYYYQSGIDGEPDLYIYNFNGYTGKFFIADGQVYDITRNNIKFTKGSNNFIAITPDGYKYYFNVVEKSKTNAGLEGMAGCDFVSIGSYFLTRIESPFDNTVGVNFFYTSFQQKINENTQLYASFEDLDPEEIQYVPQLSQLSENYTVTDDIDGNYGHNRTFSTTYINIQYLTRIEFNNGSIDFNIGIREDMYGFRLNNISINHKGESSFKRFTLNYNYFIGSRGYGGDNFSLINYKGYRHEYPENYRKKRLKLLSVTETSFSEEKKHSFEYFEHRPLPYKSSFAQDYWGFFNDGFANSTLVPDFRRYLYQMAIPNIFHTWHGANREPNDSNSKTGLLKKIIYPTKGSTEFDFESNIYTNLTEQQGYGFSTKYVFVEDLNKDQNGVYQAGQVRKEFTIPVKASGAQTVADISLTLFCNCSSNQCDCGNTDCTTSISDLQFSLFAYLERWNASTNSWDLLVNHQWDLSRPQIGACGTGGNYWYQSVLIPGLYRATVNLPDKERINGGTVQNKVGSPGSKMASMVIKYDEILPKTNTADGGGGLRVKRITNVDHILNKTTERTFTYEGGIMMHFPLFYWYTIRGRKESNYNVTAPAENLVIYSYAHLYSSPTASYSNSANGSLVGYRKVTEHLNGNGRIEYSYKVREDLLDYRLILSNQNNIVQYIPGVPSTPYLDNGTLESIKYYKEGDITPIKEIINTYDVIATEMFWNFKTELVLNENSNPLQFCGNFFTCFYPIKMGKVIQVFSTERTYNNGQSISRNTEFKYDNTTHLQLTRKIETHSDGNKFVTQLLYPDDYADNTGFIHEMKSANMTAKPVEIVNYVTDRDGNNIKILSGKVTTYKTGNKIGLPDKDWFLETNAPIPLSSFKFTNKCCVNLLPHVGSKTTFGAKDSRYPLAERFNYDFDQSGNLIQIRSSGESLTAYLWDYNKTIPVAQVSNAQVKDIFFTSFEDVGINESNCKSGIKVYRSAYVKSLTGLSNGSYILSYWKRMGGVWSQVRIGVQVINTTYEINIPDVSMLTPIDELRFIPANAEIKTFTYNPLVGVTTIADPNGNTTDFEYDPLGRLKLVRDTDKKITNHYEYHYQE